jgi:hypothetical protein
LSWLNELVFKATDGLLHLLEFISSKDTLKLYGPSIKVNSSYGGNEIKREALMKNDIKMTSDDLGMVFNILMKKISALRCLGLSRYTWFKKIGKMTMRIETTVRNKIASNFMRQSKSMGGHATLGK